MNKKFELDNTQTKKLHNGTVLYRIIALRSGPWGSIGTVGGWVEEEFNLSHDGDCWVYGEAMVYNKARLSGDWCIHGTAECSGMRVSGLGTIVSDCREDKETTKPKKQSYVNDNFDLLRNLW